MRRRVLFFAVLYCSLILAHHAKAENRALLIGVGQYAMSEANLPGIDVDIQRMREAVKQLGFKESGVKVLLDREATLDAIVRAIEGWLIAGTRPEDRAMIYFSGHGSRIADPRTEAEGRNDDGIIQVLVPHDMGVEEQHQTLVRVLHDYRFGELIRRIPSKEVLVFLDACHSGTATKDLLLVSRAIPKSFYYKGMPQSRTKDLSASRGMSKAKGVSSKNRASSDDNYISLAACEDHEKALVAPEGRGSYFTMALGNAIREASGGGGKGANVARLREETAAFIQKNVEKGAEVFHPFLCGNMKLAQVNILADKAPSGSESNTELWTQLEQLADRASYKLEATTGRLNYKLGDTLEINCRIEKDGYLNIVNVSPGDEQPVVLFPNRKHPDNRVKAGMQVSVPAPGDQYVLRAKTAGKALVVIFHTQKEINAYQQGQGDKAKNLFMMLSPLSLKGIWEYEETSSPDSFGAVKIVTTVEQ